MLNSIFVLAHFPPQPPAPLIRYVAASSGDFIPTAEPARRNRNLHPYVTPRRGRRTQLETHPNPNLRPNQTQNPTRIHLTQPNLTDQSTQPNPSFIPRAYAYSRSLVLTVGHCGLSLTPSMMASILGWSPKSLALLFSAMISAREAAGLSTAFSRRGAPDRRKRSTDTDTNNIDSIGNSKNNGIVATNDDITANSHKIAATILLITAAAATATTQIPTPTPTTTKQYQQQGVCEYFGWDGFLGRCLFPIYISESQPTKKKCCEKKVTKNTFSTNSKYTWVG